MNTKINKNIKIFMKKLINTIILCFFTFSQVIFYFPHPVLAQEINTINSDPVLSLSPHYAPAAIKGLEIHPQDPFEFTFLIDKGEMAFDKKEKNEVYDKLIKYFLTAVTIPQDDLWVNLSPYESNRMIPKNFALTEMGRDLLAQDQLLKQMMASLIHPGHEVGRRFWDKVYARAQEIYGHINIPINTYNKVWIIPESAAVFESGNTALIVNSYLKVMLEEDYLALKKNLENDKDFQQKETAKQVNDLSSQIIRDVVIPILEEEVNTGRHFAPLRQAFHSIILALWYKQTLEKSLLSKKYADKSKVEGINQKDISANQLIYEQYLQMFQEGIYSFIQEETDPATKELIPRKYFSGGLKATKVLRVDNVDNLGTQERRQLIQIAQRLGIGAIDSVHCRMRGLSGSSEMKPAFLTRSQQMEILSHLDLAPDAQEAYVEWTRGMSAGYFSVLKYFARIGAGLEQVDIVPSNLVTLKHRARRNVRKVIHQMRDIDGDKGAYDALSAVVQGEVRLNDLDTRQRDTLLKYGLIGREQGQLFTAPLVSEMVSDMLEREEADDLPGIIQTEAMRQLIQSREFAYMLAQRLEAAAFMNMSQDNLKKVIQENSSLAKAWQRFEQQTIDKGASLEDIMVNRTEGGVELTVSNSQGDIVRIGNIPFIEEGMRVNEIEEKVARNMAGFYAFESGLSTLAAREDKDPFDIIAATAERRLKVEDKDVQDILRTALMAWTEAGDPAVVRSFDLNTGSVDSLRTDELKPVMARIVAGAQVLYNNLSDTVHAGYTQTQEREFKRQIDELVDAFKDQYQNILHEDLAPDAERDIRDTARIVMFAHQYQKRADGRPYFVHQLTVCRRWFEYFKVTDPLGVMIALLHDTREDQETFYSVYRDYARKEWSDRRGESLDERDRQDERYHAVTLGVRLLSNLEGPEFQHIRNKRKDYFRRMTSPKDYYDDPAKDGPWYNDDYIHMVQLIKLADILSNISDIEKLFHDIPAGEHRDLSYWTRRFLRKAMTAVDVLVMNSKHLTLADKEIFYGVFDKQLERYEEFAGQSDRGLQMLAAIAAPVRERLKTARGKDLARYEGERESEPQAEDAPDARTGKAKVDHLTRNRHLRSLLEQGQVVDFMHQGEALQLNLVQGEDNAQEEKAASKYQQWNQDRIQGIYQNIERMLKKVQKGNVPEDLQAHFNQEFRDKNNLEKANLIRLFETVLNARLRVVKDAYYVDLDETKSGSKPVLLHAGRGVHYTESKVWIGEKAVQTLSDLDVIKMMLEEGLHMINPEGQHGKKIYHNNKFLSGIARRLKTAQEREKQIPVGIARLGHMKREMPPAMLAHIQHQQETFGYIDDREPVVRVIDRITRSMLAEKGLNADEFVIGIVDDPEANAGIHTGWKYVEFYRGMIDFLSRNGIFNKDTIAFIMGHETGHMLEKQKKDEARREEQGEEEEEGEDDEEDEADHLTVSEEYRADEHGLEIMDIEDAVEGAFNPLAALKFMEAVRKEEKQASITVTHPHAHRREVKIYNDLRSRYWHNLGGEVKPFSRREQVVRPTAQREFDEKLYRNFSIDNMRDMVDKARTVNDLTKLANWFYLHMFYSGWLADYVRQTKVHEFMAGRIDDLFDKLPGEILADFSRQVHTTMLFEQYLRDEGIDVRQYFNPDQIKKAERLAQTKEAVQKNKSVEDILIRVWARVVMREQRKTSNVTDDCLTPMQVIFGGQASWGYVDKYFNPKRFRAQGYFELNKAMRNKAEELIGDLAQFNKHDREMLLNHFVLPEMVMVEMAKTMRHADYSEFQDNFKFEPEDGFAVAKFLLEHANKYVSTYTAEQAEQNQEHHWMDLARLERFRNSRYGENAAKYLKELFEAMTPQRDERWVFDQATLPKEYQDLDLSDLRSLLELLLRNKEIMAASIYNHKFLEVQNALIDLVLTKIGNLKDFTGVFQNINDEDLGTKLKLANLHDVILHTRDLDDLFNGLDFLLSRSCFRDNVIREMSFFVRRALDIPVAGRSLGRSAEEGILLRMDEVFARRKMDTLEALHAKQYSYDFKTQGAGAVLKAYEFAIHQVRDRARQPELLIKYIKQYGQQFSETNIWGTHGELSYYAEQVLHRALYEYWDEQGWGDIKILEYFAQYGLVPTKEMMEIFQYSGWARMTDYQTGPSAVPLARQILKEQRITDPEEIDWNLKMVRKGERVIYAGNIENLFEKDAEVKAKQKDRDRIMNIFARNKELFLSNGLSEDDYAYMHSHLVWEWYYPNNIRFIAPRDLAGMVARLIPSKYNAVRFERGLVRPGPSDGEVILENIKKTAKKMFPYVDIDKWADYLHFDDGSSGSVQKGIVLTDLSDKDYQVLVRLGERCRIGDSGIPHFSTPYGIFYNRFEDGKDRDEYLKERENFEPVWSRDIEWKMDSTLRLSHTLLQEGMKRDKRLAAGRQLAMDKRIRMILKAFPEASRTRNKILLSLIGNPLRHENPLDFEPVFPHLMDSEIRDILARRILLAKVEAGDIEFNAYDAFVKVMDEYFPEESFIRYQTFHELLQQVPLTIKELEELNGRHILEDLAKSHKKRTLHMALEWIGDNVEHKPAKDKREALEWLMGVRETMPKLIQFYEAATETQFDDLPIMLSYEPRSVTEVFLSSLLLGSKGVLNDPKERNRLLSNVFKHATGQQANNQNILYVLFKETFKASPQPKQLDLLTGVVSIMIDDSGPDDSRRRVNYLIRDTLSLFGTVGDKIGQFLSRKTEYLDADLIEVLETLTDSVDPANKRYLLNALLHDHKLEELEKNIAYVGELRGSASMGQVYRVKLADGQERALKYIRPMAHYEVRENLQILEELLFTRLPGKNKRLDEILGDISHEMFDEVKTRLARELDIDAEMQDQELVALFNQSQPEVDGWRLAIPKVDARLKGTKFFASEFIYGRKLDSALIKELREDGNLKAVYKVLAANIIKQMFLFGLYHADLHAGNIYVDLENKVVNLIDFGSTGTLSVENQQRAMDILSKTDKMNADNVIRLLEEMTQGGDWSEVRDDVRQIVVNDKKKTIEKIIEIKRLLDKDSIHFDSEFQFLFKSFEAMSYVFEQLSPIDIKQIFTGIVIARITGQSRHVTALIKKQGEGHKSDQPRSDVPAIVKGEASPDGGDNIGGIDLNPQMLKIETQGSSIRSRIPEVPQELLEIDIKGFIPIIIDVVPATTLPLPLSSIQDGSRNSS